jgi:hypothetical protein
MRLPVARRGCTFSFGFESLALSIMKLTDASPTAWSLADRMLVLGPAMMIFGPRSGFPGSEWSYEIGLLFMVVALTFCLTDQIRQRRASRAR